MTDIIATKYSELIAGNTIRTESTKPVAYRLARRSTHPCGVPELVLQGAYEWREGRNGGVEWRDIPTVDLEPPA